MAISVLVREMHADVFIQPGHVLTDEEDSNIARDLLKGSAT